MPQSPSIDTLPTEILPIIIRDLDAPSLVCLALTNHTFNTFILQTFKVDRLGQICLKDVRSKIPKALASKAYNLLVSDEYSCSHQGAQTHHETDHTPRVGWQIVNFHSIPSPQDNVGTDNPKSVQFAIQIRAYLRRNFWLYPSSGAAQGFQHAKSIALHSLSLLSDRPTDHDLRSRDGGLGFDPGGAIFAIVPVEECKDYITWCRQADSHHSMIVARVAKVLLKNDVVESVEYMVLKGLLRGWVVKN